MVIVTTSFGLLLIAVVLWDAFETILLPRRIASRFRISRTVLRSTWRVWAALGRRIAARNQRENFLSNYALLSLIGLLVVWAAGLVVGFAFLHWGAGSRLTAQDMNGGLLADLYMSGTTFFTLGLGDVVPASAAARLITVVEAGTGFGFLALVLAYLPVLYQSFSRREVRITMLDEWAGSPPAAAVILRRAFESRDPSAALNTLLRDWEHAAAEILESHLSYGILAFFRSQHDNQSWLAALGTILDSCALVIVGVEGIDPFQARLTFAICRHTLVDVSQNLMKGRMLPDHPPEALAGVAELEAWLTAAGVPVARGDDAVRRLAELRGMYMPYLASLSALLLTPMPGWLPPARSRYNWETTAWARTRPEDAP